jgi:IS30 family transposase
MAATEEQWLAARMRWEADPTCSGAEIARELEVARNTVNQRIKKYNWKRVSNQADLARRAHDRADEAAAKVELDQRKERAKALIAEGREQEAAAIQERGEQTVETAIDMRATILSRHRTELDKSRSLIYKAIESDDFDKAKLGKITAEALVIVQNGERKAWGMDAEDKNAGPGGEVKVVIERREVPLGAR